MARIKWVGIQRWGTEYPDNPLPENAVQIKVPENYLKASWPYAILPAAIGIAALFLKRWHYGEFPLDRPFILAGIIVGLLLTPLHELLHAVCFPKGTTAYIGIAPDKFAAFAVCHFPVSRRRFIVMSLMPVVLGVVPLVLFILFPIEWKIASAICWGAGIFGLISPSPDYMDVIRFMKQVPKRAWIQSINKGWVWYWKR